MKEKSMKEVLETLKSEGEIIIEDVGKMTLKKKILKSGWKGTTVVFLDIFLSLKVKGPEGNDCYDEPFNVDLLNPWLIRAVYNLDEKKEKEIFSSKQLMDDFDDALKDWKKLAPGKETALRYLEKQAEVFDDLIKQYL